MPRLIAVTKTEGGLETAVVDYGTERGLMAHVSDESDVYYFFQIPLDTDENTWTAYMLAYKGKVIRGDIDGYCPKEVYEATHFIKHRRDPVVRLGK